MKKCLISMLLLSLSITAFAMTKLQCYRAWDVASARNSASCTTGKRFYDTPCIDRDEECCDTDRYKGYIKVSDNDNCSMKIYCKYRDKDSSGWYNYRQKCYLTEHTLAEVRKLKFVNSQLSVSQ